MKRLPDCFGDYGNPECNPAECSASYGYRHVESCKLTTERKERLDT